MSLVSISQLLPPSTIYAQQSVYQNVAGETETFDLAMDRAEATQTVEAGKPLQLYNADLLTANRETEDVAPQMQGTVTKTNEIRDLTSAEELTRTTEDDDFGFWDFVDLINPLQHLPLIGTIYRKVTGDEIKPEVQVAGSLLLGVATGSILMSAASGIASVVFEEHTGQEPGDYLADALLGSDGEEKIDLDRPEEEKIQFASSEYINPEFPREVYELQDARTYVAERQAEVKRAEATQNQNDYATSQALIAEQARLSQMANPSSPDFVRDFMMQALDKYQMANSQGLGRASTVQ